jgi:hypothetical protein
MKRTLKSLMLVLVVAGSTLFSCSKMDSDVAPEQDNLGISTANTMLGKLNINDWTLLQMGRTNESGYRISDATSSNDNKTWEFSIVQVGDARGIGLSNMVISYNLCPDEVTPKGLEVSSASITGPSGAEMPGVVIQYTVGGGTECFKVGTVDDFFKLDNLSALGSQVVHTVTFTFSEAININEFVIWIKAGSNCKPATIDGGTCDIKEGCSYSQGYFFAKPYSTWAGKTVILGGNTYTEQEGRDIFRSSNAGGMASSKKSFLQAATIMLSFQRGFMNTAQYEEFAVDINLINTYLTGFPKLSTLTRLPSGDNNEVTEAEALRAAGRLNDFIRARHCDNNPDFISE